MKKLEELEKILSILAEWKRIKKFEDFIPTQHIQDFYGVLLEFWNKKEQTIDQQQVLKKLGKQTIKGIDHANNQLIGLFYVFCHWELKKGGLKEGLKVQILHSYIYKGAPFNLLKVAALDNLVQAFKQPQNIEEYYMSAWAHKEFYFSNKFPTKEEKGALEVLNKADVHLDISYSIYKLRIVLEKISRHYSLGEPFPMVNFQLPIINYRQNLTLELYTNLYLLVQYTRHEGNESPICRELLDTCSQILMTDIVALDRSDVEFCIIFLINYLSVERGPQWTLHIYNLYKKAIEKEYLVQVGGKMKFEDFSNIISSCINYKDKELLAELTTLIAQYAMPKEKRTINDLHQIATFYLHKEWQKLFSFEEETEKKGLSLSTHYKFQVHILKIKAVFESFVKEYFKEVLTITLKKENKPKDIEIEGVLRSYKTYINQGLNSADNPIPKQMGEANLHFIKHLNALYKILTKGSFKKEKRIKLKKWGIVLESPILYLNWLKELYEDILKELT